MPAEISDQQVAEIIAEGAGLGGAPDNGTTEPAEPPLRHPHASPRKRKGAAGEPSANARAKKAKRAREKGGSSASSTPRPVSDRQRTKELELALGRLLTAPVVPTLMLPLELESKQFLASHFTTAGPKTAHDLAVASETSPELREILERLTQGSAAGAILMAALLYAAPPVLWMIGMRGPAQMVSVVASLDDAALESMIPPDAPAAPPPEHRPAGPEHQGPESTTAEAEPPPAV